MHSSSRYPQDHVALTHGLTPRILCRLVPPVGIQRASANEKVAALLVRVPTRVGAATSSPGMKRSMDTPSPFLGEKGVAPAAYAGGGGDVSPFDSKRRTR
ncbi:MAG: hypothetical protein A4E58_02972 [Syntrophorhabdus sp. PtaB.Bin006]|nr:MAG: hypothetical protein A4E58_02972 [Syntrophorhabdus sp. PtaB.Bin006]